MSAVSPIADASGLINREAYPWRTCLSKPSIATTGTAPPESYKTRSASKTMTCSTTAFRRPGPRTRAARPHHRLLVAKRGRLPSVTLSGASCVVISSSTCDAITTGVCEPRNGVRQSSCTILRNQCLPYLRKQTSLSAADMSAKCQKRTCRLPNRSPRRRLSALRAARSVPVLWPSWH